MIQIFSKRGCIRLILSAICSLGSACIASEIPDHIITVLEQGLQISAGGLSQVSYSIDADQATIDRLAKTKSPAITNYLRFTTNTYEIDSLRKNQTAAKSTIFDQRGQNPTPFQYGWTERYMWKKVGDEVPWLVPLKAPGVENDAIANSIKALLSSQQNIFLHLQTTFSAPFLVGGSNFKYSRTKGRLEWTSPQNQQIDVDVDFRTNQIFLKYTDPTAKVPVVGRLSIESVDGLSIVTAISFYFQEISDNLPNRIVHIQNIFTSDHKMQPADDFLPQTHYGWSHWLEYVNGQWVTKTRSGRITPINTNTPAISLFSRGWFRIFVLTLVIGSLCYGGVWFFRKFSTSNTVS